jgi:hypothetical protein
MKNKLSIKKLFQNKKRIRAVFHFLIIYGQSGPDFKILADKAFLKLYQNSDECISYTQEFL